MTMRWCRVLFLATLTALPLPLPAANGTDLEARVKAAFLFNFARFVSWPDEKFESPNSVIRICVLKGETFRGVLDEVVAGKSVAARPLRVEERVSPAALGDCHIAYFGQGASSESMLAAATGHNILLVHEGDITRDSGVVRFYLEDRRVRFEVNASAAQRETLQLSSKLLSVARVVNQ